MIYDLSPCFLVYESEFLLWHISNSGAGECMIGRHDVDSVKWITQPGMQQGEEPDGAGTIAPSHSCI